jgi:hypothetical protein
MRELFAIPIVVALFEGEEKPQAVVPEVAEPARKRGEPDRYIVENTTVFELLGSTVTFREGQIIRPNTREYQIARDFDVPLRPLAPILR